MKVKTNPVKTEVDRNFTLEIDPMNQEMILPVRSLSYSEYLLRKYKYHRKYLLIGISGILICIMVPYCERNVFICMVFLNLNLIHNNL